MIVLKLNDANYHHAWQLQERIHASVVDGGQEHLLIVEHAPVITLGRRAGNEIHIVASDDMLRAKGVEVVQSDRGGDVTFHGPGQLVCYPIIRLIDHQLSVGSYVRCLEIAMIETLAQFRIDAGKDACAIGVWVKSSPDAKAAKIGAVGVRVRRGVTLHGLAMNVSTDLSYFDLIVPCGLKGRPVTSMKKILGDACPATDAVESALVENIRRLLNTPRDRWAVPKIVGEGKPLCDT